MERAADAAAAELGRQAFTELTDLGRRMSIQAAADYASSADLDPADQPRAPK